MMKEKGTNNKEERAKNHAEKLRRKRFNKDKLKRELKPSRVGAPFLAA